MTARDIRYGRQGGRNVAFERPRLTGPPCEVCGRPMLLGQARRHLVCVTGQLPAEPEHHDDGL